MTTKNKIILSIVIFAVLFILLIIFVIYPLFVEIKKNSQAITSQKGNLVALEAKIENLEKFKNLYNEYKPNLEKIDNLFINAEVPVGFISFLEKTSKDCQIEIEISPPSTKKTEKDFWTFLTFQIRSISSFPNFLQFLEKLETSPYLIEIQNLNISKFTGGEDFSGADAQASLSIKIYTQ